MQLSLYVHFPFCKQKCLYCDFCSAPQSESMIRAYCTALIAEIRHEAEAFAGAKVSTVFFGGGTPSVVPADCMAEVLTVLRENFDFLPDVEFTSQANPGTLTPEWLKVMREGGVNRISLGVQAAQDDLLKRIGRIHTFGQACEAVEMVRTAGIANINTDLMYGLPGQVMQDYLTSIRKVAQLGVNHISAYSLILQEGTPLEALVTSGKLILPQENDVADMEEAGQNLLARLGYKRYEISNYAKPGYCCRHNLGYWQDAWYLGLGVAAHSMLPSGQPEGFRIRRANISSVEEYISAAGNPENCRTVEFISPNDAMFETVMLSLRTVEGLNMTHFSRLYGITLQQRYGNVMTSLINDGLALLEGGQFRLTEKGLSIQNTVLMRFMD